MIEQLEELGIENKVFVPVYSGTKRNIVPNENVIVSHCFNKVDRCFFDYKQSKIRNSLEKSIDVNSFDIIHAYTLFTDGNVAYRMSKKYGIPYVVAIRNTDVNSFFSKMIHLRKRGIKIMRNAKKIFFLSNAYKQQVFDKYVPEKYKDALLPKVEIIPNGIDDFWPNNINMEKRQINPKEIRLVTACTVDKNKNIGATQKAMKLLNAEGYDVSLTVAGSVVDKKLYKKLNKDPKTAFVGKKTKEELLTIYRNSDIFVMPSIHESFGLVYAEAMTQGLPVIYTKGQGFDEQYQEGEVGHSVVCSQPKTIYTAILDIVDKYEQISSRCGAFSIKFTWDKLTKQYLKIYYESDK